MPDPVTILLVEDDPGHARLIEKNLKREKVANKLVIVRNGKEATDYLFGEGMYSDFERPSTLLVLLDLNLPVMNGFQVLQRVKSNDKTKGIPVIVLTSADDKGDVVRCYDLGCNVFMTKPVNYEKFCETIRNLAVIMSVISLPERG
ncbi:MAG: response regulator [Desulfomonile tiedjei]|uniref:Response regulator n=1 Tax=Desulfomonile tiedjei TaxID=2358 RepID=A0A9D6Z288_9BACT|nr:response regulator [Desulfomonile tiedjei]